MTNNYAIQIPAPSKYGAVELKKFINKFTLRGFILSLSFFALLIILYVAGVKITTTTAKAPMFAPIARGELLDISQESEDVSDIPPPPTQTIINSGPASRAGTPVPVPDAEITDDLKEFANVDELTRASSQGGEGIDLGGMASNIDFNAKEDVNVKVREKEPGIDEFIATEKDPYIDLNELQKKIKYPEIARRAGIEGKVLIRVLVGENGKPKKYRIEQTDNAQLNKAAIDAVMSSVFTPAIQNKKPVQCWITIPVNFRLR